MVHPLILDLSCVGNKFGVIFKCFE